jgi:hypothetical protein
MAEGAKAPKGAAAVMNGSRQPLPGLPAGEVQEPQAIVDAIVAAWNDNYGLGSNTSKDEIGGYLCRDWARFFRDAPGRPIRRAGPSQSARHEEISIGMERGLATKLLRQADAKATRMDGAAPQSSIGHAGGAYDTRSGGLFVVDYSRASASAPFHVSGSRLCNDADVPKARGQRPGEVRTRGRWT